MATKQVSKKSPQGLENDDPITIRPSQLRLLIAESLEETLKRLRLGESGKEKDSDEKNSRKNLESMSAVQVKKRTNQRAAHASYSFCP